LILHILPGFKVILNVVPFSPTSHLINGLSILPMLLPPTTNITSISFNAIFNLHLNFINMSSLPISSSKTFNAMLLGSGPQPQPQPSCPHHYHSGSSIITPTSDYTLPCVIPTILTTTFQAGNSRRINSALIRIAYLLYRYQVVRLLNVSFLTKVIMVATVPNLLHLIRLISYVLHVFNPNH
jgi:hypothetical protein